MRFGVNYIPSDQWLHRWLNWDTAAVDNDLKEIAALGMDHIRAHLIWPYFQLDANRMSKAAMENLNTFVGLCEKNGLDFCLTLFTGWMSGSVYFPAWLTSDIYGGRKNMFADPKIIETEKYYMREIAKVVGKSARFLGFDLGNELSALVPTFQPEADMEICDAWHREIMAFCREIAPGKLHNSGVDHTPWFGKCAFSRDVLANDCDIVALHCWTEFTGARKIGGIMGTESIHIADFLVELAKACSRDNRHKYWIQEFGSTPLWHDDGSAPEDFLRRTLEELSLQPDVWGVTWWCSHEIDREFVSFDSLEYELGLFDLNHKPKATALVIEDFIYRHRAGEFKTVDRSEAVVLDEKKFDEDAWNQVQRYMEAVKQGYRPAIVWKDDADDKNRLTERGIKRLLG